MNYDDQNLKMMSAVAALFLCMIFFALLFDLLLAVKIFGLFLLTITIIPIYLILSPALQKTGVRRLPGFALSRLKDSYNARRRFIKDMVIACGVSLIIVIIGRTHIASQNIEAQRIDENGISIEGTMLSRNVTQTEKQRCDAYDCSDYTETSYYMVYAYIVSGVSYQRRIESRNLYDNFEEGQSVNVIYNRRNPRQSWIEGHYQATHFGEIMSALMFMILMFYLVSLWLVYALRILVLSSGNDSYNDLKQTFSNLGR